MCGVLMNYEYVVEVRSALIGLLDHLTFEDANSAYFEYRVLQDMYYNDDLIVVTLIEPE
jgi:hypothetical protein